MRSGLCSSFSSTTDHLLSTGFLKAHQATYLVAARGWFMPVATLESSGETLFSKHRPPLSSTPGDSKLLILEICSKNLFLRGSQVDKGHQGEGCSPLAICHLSLLHSQMAIWSHSKLPGQAAQDLRRQSAFSGGFPQPPLWSLHCTETSRSCCQSLWFFLPK